MQTRRNDDPTSDRPPTSRVANDARPPTPREDYGAVLASLARLYRDAEESGDLARAERYAAAVDMLLSACPRTDEVDALDAESSEPPTSSVWPLQESTLVGLGVV